MRTTLRTLAAAGLAAFLAAGAAAQPAPGRRAPMARMMDALQLTDAQRQKVQPILDEHRAAATGLRDKLRADREALRTAAEAANADPAAVGRAFLALKADRQAAKAQRDALRSRIAAVLTPEQNAKLDGFFAGMRAGRRMGRGPMAGGGFGR